MTLKNVLSLLVPFVEAFLTALVPWSQAASSLAATARL
jgi:hypothetical protein